MILRRITEHVKAQNWFAVGLDFLIVVVGVFVGLQVSNWNEARRQSAAENAYLHLLADDLAQIRAAIETPAALVAGRREAMLRVLVAIETCSESEASREDFDLTFSSYQNTVGFPVRDATYQEMLATGALASLRGDDLKRKITLFYTEIENFNRNYPRIRDSLTIVDGIVWRKVRLTVAQNREISGQTEGAIRLADYDFQKMCDDIELMNAIVEMIDMQSDWRGVFGAVVVRLEDLEAGLSEALSSENRNL